MVLVKNPFISAIIPAYNEELYIEKCIASLKNQDLDESMYEIIVVDNGSNDNTYELAKNTGVTVLKEPQRGVSSARNKGAGHARGELLVFPDADCLYPKDWLTRIVNIFKESSDLDALGGTFVFYDATPFWEKASVISKIFVYHIAGGNMAVRKKAFQQVGGFDTRYNIGEELLLELKLRDLKKKVKIDRSLVISYSFRRFKKSFLKLSLFWFINDLWILLFRKPLNHNYRATAR
jgi:glycosyltransferase involved in cell wall biosynthesis